MIGMMVAFESKVKKGEAKVGKIVEVSETDMVVHMYEGKLNGILNPAVKLDGTNKVLKISRQRLYLPAYGHKENTCIGH